MGEGTVLDYFPDTTDLAARTARGERFGKRNITEALRGRVEGILQEDGASVIPEVPQ